jgi:hypothetical protein
MPLWRVIETRPPSNGSRFPWVIEHGRHPLAVAERMAADLVATNKWEPCPATILVTSCGQ